MGGASIIVCSLPRLRLLSREAFDRTINLAFIVSRLGAYLGVFFVLHIAPRGDLMGFYWPEATAVLEHRLPYRDFQSSYAPLHAYLDASVIRVWLSPLAIILLAICVEMLLLPLWLRVGRFFLEEQELRSGALLYLTSAISLQFVTIDGQDNIIVAVLFALALLLLARKHALSSGAAMGLSVATVKFLPLLYFPAFFVAVPKRWRWLAGASLIIAVVYGLFVAIHLPIFEPLVVEGGLRSAGDLPYLIEGITGIFFPSIVWDSLVLLAFASVFFLVARASRHASLALRLRILTFGFAALTLSLIIFAKKSWPNYLTLALFPICLFVGTKSKLRVAVFALFGVCAVVSNSYWATAVDCADALAFHSGLLAHDQRWWIVLVLQLVLLTGLFWLLWASIREISQGRLLVEPDLPLHPVAAQKSEPK